MPNLSTHLGIAKEAASRLRHPAVDRHLGAFLLGSVSPDIHIITRGERGDTHFTHLTFQRVGEGVAGLFRLHPGLSQADRLTEPTRAFVVGYASHLLVDELWIVEVYRPFFANRQGVQDFVRDNLMDRALQMELDRREQEALGGLETLRPLLARADKGVQVGFIPPGTLCEWRRWVESALERGFAWDRLHYMARRASPEGEPPAEDQLEEMEEMIEEFLDAVPQGLERIYQVVPWERVEAVREKALQELLKFAREYLN